MADGGGLSRLQRRMRAAAVAPRAAIPGALAAGVQAVVDSIRGMAPVDTGALRQSVVATPPGGSTPAYGTGGQRTAAENQTLVTAGNSAVRYAHLVEFGTARSAAHPFFWPGYWTARARAQQAMAEHLRGAVRNAG